jgi:hypothetical protein
MPGVARQLFKPSRAKPAALRRRRTWGEFRVAEISQSSGIFSRSPQM